MKIRQIGLRNFKRFSDTTITGIPETARLVILVGPNGCGKSSLIDAAQIWRNQNWDETYHRKQIPGEQIISWDQSVSLAFYEAQPPPHHDRRRKAVYARSAYRNEADFTLDRLGRVEHVLHEHRVNRLIDNDQAVSSNYRRLVSQGMEDVYERADGTQTIAEFRERSIGVIRDAMQRLFPGLVLNGLGNPLADATFRFDKGDSKAFLYKNLSGGEKAAFDLLLDIFIKRHEYDDTVYFIDEPEAHMSAALQSALLDELFRAVPQKSQLWLATHSIGMMRRARELAQQQPETVVFLDLDGINFDLPQTIRPAEPNRPFWKRAMQVALDDLAGYVTPEHIILCEGGALQGGKDFDSACYNLIFQVEHPQAVFIGAGNSDDIRNDPRGIQRLLTALAPDVRITRVLDRDDRTDDERRELQAQNIRVLSLRNVESYLLDDTVLAALCAGFGQPDAVSELLRAKEDAVKASVQRGNPLDDLKSAAGEIYNAAKRLFPDRKLGSETRAFMKGVCASLIKPNTPIYERLQRDIFG